MQVTNSSGRSCAEFSERLPFFNIMELECMMWFV